MLSVGCCFMKLSCWGEEATTSPGAGLGSKHSPVAELLHTSSSRNAEKCPSDVSHKRDMAEDGNVTESCASLGETGTVDPSPLDEERQWGYPMSAYHLQHLPASETSLSYEAREVACHSIDSFRERLISKTPTVQYSMSPPVRDVAAESMFFCFRQFSSRDGSLSQSCS